MAERVGFEPTVQLPAHMISSHASSTNSCISPTILSSTGFLAIIIQQKTGPVLSKSLLQSLRLEKSMEQTGFEPVTSSVRGMRSPN